MLIQFLVEFGLTNKTVSTCTVQFDYPDINISNKLFKPNINYEFYKVYNFSIEH